MNYPKSSPSRVSSPLLSWSVGLAAFCFAFTIAEGGPMVGGLDHEALEASAYPLAPVVYYEGELCDVVGGQSGRVVIATREGERALADDATIMLSKGVLFEDGFINVSESRIRLVALDEDPAAGLASNYAKRAAQPVGTRLFVSLRSQLSYDDVLVCVVFYTDFGQRELHAQKVGALPADQDVSLSFDLPFAYEADGAELQYAYLFFTPRGEIVSDGRRQATPFLNYLFEDFYQALVTSYVQGADGESRPARVAQSYPIQFAGEAAEAAVGAEARFELEIDESGFVRKVMAADELDPRLRDACSRALQEWLFLPELRDGFPVASRARVPVRLESVQ